MIKNTNTTKKKDLDYWYVYPPNGEHDKRHHTLRGPARPATALPGTSRRREKKNAASTFQAHAAGPRPPPGRCTARSLGHPPSTVTFLKPTISNQEIHLCFSILGNYYMTDLGTVMAFGAWDTPSHMQ